MGPAKAAGQEFIADWEAFGSPACWLSLGIIFTAECPVNFFPNSPRCWTMALNSGKLKNPCIDPADVFLLRRALFAGLHTMSFIGLMTVRRDECAGFVSLAFSQGLLPYV